MYKRISVSVLVNGSRIFSFNRITHCVSACTECVCALTVWLIVCVGVKVLRERRCCPMDTCDLVDEDAGGDDASVLGEELL